MFNIIAVLFIISPLIISLTIAFAGSKKIRINEIELNKYKRKRFERVRWIFNEQLPSADCPVMLLRGAVLKDKSTGKNMLQLKFINTGTQTIKSAYAVIDFIDDAGDIVAKGSSIQAEYLDINCASKDSFGQKQLLDLGEIGAIHIVITYSKVVFTDGTVWRAGTDGQASKPVQVTLLKNALPPELQNEVSEEIICKPERLGHGLWRCTCGCLVRGTDGDICLNCQQTFVNAQESSSVSTLEKRKQKRIAEQEQKALVEQVTKKQSKEYIIQLICANFSLYIGTVCVGIILDMGYSLGLSSSAESEIGIVIYAILSGISVITTAFLVQKFRKGQPNDTKSIRKIIKLQGITALVPPCVIFIFGLIWSLSDIRLILYTIVFLIPNIVYCYQLSYVRIWLTKNKKVKEIIAFAICIISVIIAISFIIQIPSHMHFYIGGGFSFDSEILRPCIISVAIAGGAIFYCSRLSSVKDWLTKRKRKKRDK